MKPCECHCGDIDPSKIEFTISTKQPCGHHVSAIRQSKDGTCYCLACEFRIPASGKIKLPVPFPWEVI